MTDSQSQANSEHAEIDLRIEIMPPLFDKLCCSAGPLMGIFAASVVEYIVPAYALFVRLAGVTILAYFLYRNMRNRGVVNWNIARTNRTKILIIVLYTFAFSCALYAFFLYFATPNIINYTSTNTLMIK